MQTSCWLLDTSFDEWSYPQGYTASVPGKLIHIDTDQVQVGRFYFPEIGICADAKTALRQILDCLKDMAPKQLAYKEQPNFRAIKRAKMPGWLSSLIC